MLSPSQMNNFSPDDSLNIAKALVSGKKKINKKMAKNLGANIPKTAKIADVISIASAIPLECFNNSSPADLVSAISDMDTENMDTFRKSFIANKIIKSKSKDTIQNLLKSTSDKTMINSIPANMFESLNIDVSTIPATNLPKSFMKKYSRTILKSQNLEDITDQSVLSKILPGITKSDLNKIGNASQKVDSIVNMVNASLENDIELSSSQVRF